MSNADPAEVTVSISGDGVSVEKSFEPNDFPVPAIAFVVRSERDETVTVRLSDQVPDRVDAEDIGFHPKYGSEFWSVEDGNIVFEREFEAGEEYTTVYGLRASQTDDVDSFMSEPTLEAVDPPADDAGQVVRDVIGDENGSADSTPADAETDDDDAVEPLELDDPSGGDVEPDIEDDATGPSAAVEESSDEADHSPGGIDDASLDTGESSDTEGAAVETETGADDESGSDAGSVPADPAAALAEQIRSGDVDDDDLDELRDALGVSNDDGSTDARIQQLQSELADLRAYTNALEEFLDENGDGQRIVEDVQDRVDDVESGLEDVRDAVDDVAEEVESLSDEVTEVRESLEAVDDLEQRLETIEAEYEEAHEDIQAISRMREQLSSVFGAEMEGPTGAEDDES